MALPKLDVPMYKMKLPSTGKDITYRPFLVKEEKILLMAMEGEDQSEIMTAMKQVINNCIITEGIEVDNLPLFDIEYILLNLRSKSMGDVVRVTYAKKDCDQKGCKPIEFEINVNDVKIEKNKNHNNKIQLTKDVGVIMSYPDIEMMTSYDGSVSMDEVKPDVALQLITKCIDSVYDEENVYSKADYTPDELQEFVDQLSPDQFKKIEEFFSTIPKMYKDVEFNCEKCGYKESIRLEGLSDFFG